MAYPEIVESNEQCISMWKAFARDRTTADLIDKPGIAVCWAGSSFPYWNGLFLTEEMTDSTDLQRRLRSAADYLRANRHPGLVYVCEDYLHGDAHRQLGAAVQDAGLTVALDLFGMRCDILSLKLGVSTPQLRFERVVDDEALRTYADINSESYGYPLEAGRVALEGSALWKERSFAYIGYLDGAAVSTAAAFENAGQLYLTYVATRPGVTGRGIGEATVRRALDAAFKATGLRRTSLHSMRAGFSLYDRLGYKWVTRLIAYRLAGEG